jgi:hypothetical protein
MEMTRRKKGKSIDISMRKNARTIFSYLILFDFPIKTRVAFIQIDYYFFP